MLKLTPIVVLCVLLASGCTTIYARLSSNFQNGEMDRRVYYEPGAEDIASLVAQNLSELIKSVEEKEYIGFKDVLSIKVYVFNSKERYSKFGNISIKSRGGATTNEIYLSPRLKENKNLLPRLLAHELSHVHLRQHTGTWQHVTNIPGWFHEGMAVLTSDGGGAEKISEKEAIQSIKSGRHFVSAEAGSIWGHESGRDYGLEPQMYYRQAGLFVGFLKQIDSTAFKKSYLSLTKRDDFSKVWKKNYGRSIAELWHQFVVTRAN